MSAVLWQGTRRGYLWDHIGCLAQGASIGGMGQQLQRQLVDGHWVLAFRDSGSAQQAAQMVTDHASRLRQHYAALLAPLLKSTAADE